MAAPRLPCFAALLLVAHGAFAQGETQKAPSLPAGDVEPDEQEPPPPLVADASDTLGGHFVAGLGLALEVPFGELRGGESAANLDPGPGGALDLGFGVSRTVVVGAWGELTSYGSRGHGYALGPFVRYHLVQGVRFDPWVLGGLGYRVLTRDQPAPTKPLSGIEFLHVAVGGDYYVLDSFGFGPWLGVGMTADHTLSAASVPALVRTVGRSAAAFSMGFRLVLDLPGK